MKNWPSYKVVRYYFDDNTISSNFEFGKIISGNLVITEDLQIYFKSDLSSEISMNSSDDFNERIVPYDWVSFRQIKECVNKSKNLKLFINVIDTNLLLKVLKDIRDFKIKLITGEIDFNQL